jgi:hypothetical protein
MTSTPYGDFLARKRALAAGEGFDADPAAVHPMLHGWQAELVSWAGEVGRAALWADTGLGKTLMQLEWSRLATQGKRGLIVAPLAVCQQTVREAGKIGMDLRYARKDDGRPGLVITNYEMAPHFDPHALTSVALDESSILKDVTSKTRDRLIAQFAPVRYRLACTATPAPNDTSELCNHAEFLSAASRRQMLSTYFVHDQKGWRPKGHARQPMFGWMARWAAAIRRPSDLGYPDDGYDLPPLEIVPELLPVDVVPEGQLFATTLGGVGGRAKVRRATLAARTDRAAELVEKEPDEPWLLWCGLNDEANELSELIPAAVNVHGSMSPEEKAEHLLAFADGQIRYLITKPSIAALGLNFQHCARMSFVGLSDSYEQYYQAIRRCWRYGQTRTVRAHVVLSELEGQIADNVARKEVEATAFTNELIESMRATGRWGARRAA